MPVYGKGRVGRYRPEQLEKKGFGKVIFRAPGERRTRLRPEEWEWKQFSSPLGRVSQNLGVNLPTWIHARFEQKKKPLTVMDWGCGDGRTIEKLAQRFPNEVHAYGYDHHSREKWISNPHVKFIHQDPERMLRYMKDGSMDLIYSHYGLTHYLSGFTSGIMWREQRAYLIALAEKLAPRGMIIFNIDPTQTGEIMPNISLLKQLLPRYAVTYRIHHSGSRPYYVLRITRHE